MTEQKRVAVMQPYFLPYIGYFALVANVDEFIIFDSVQYIRRGWQNRNRIRSTDEPWSYIGVPVRKAEQSALICDIEISYDEDWQGRVRKTIEALYSRAPYYAKILDVISPLWERTNLLRDLNFQLLQQISSYLGYKPKWTFSSQKTLEHPGLREFRGQELIQGICSISQAQIYYNPAGGTALYDLAAFSKKGLVLRFIKPLLLDQIQRELPAMSDLSILDIAMYHSPAEINRVIGKLST